MEDLKIRVGSMEEQQKVYDLLEKLGYDKFWYKKSKHHIFIYADKNGEIGIGTLKDEKNFEKSEHIEVSINELEFKIETKPKN